MCVTYEILCTFSQIFSKYAEHNQVKPGIRVTEVET